MNTASLLRHSRLEANLTQSELATRSGTSQPAIARYESGDSIPSIPTLERLIHACGSRLILQTVLGETDPPSSLRACTGQHAKLLRQKRQSLLELFESEGAVNVRLFGSVARGEDTPNSDIDILVDLPPKATLLDLARIRREATNLLGVPVDVATPSMLKERIKARIENEVIAL